MDERRSVYNYCVRGEIDEALSLARDIKDSWNRCQSLSMVADYIKSNVQARMHIIDAAFSAAGKQSEPNRIVTVSAWPLEVLCRHGDLSRAKAEVERLIGIIQPEPHPVRRADALFMLVKKTHAYSSNLTKALLIPFKKACSEGRGWKIDRDLRDVSEWVAEFDHDEALNLVEIIFKPHVKRQAFRLIEQLNSIKDSQKNSQ